MIFIKCKIKKILKELDEVVPTMGGLNPSQLDQFDEMAKAVALQDVQELLYDLNKRSQFSEATALMFPFAEVHKEIVSTWSRLLRESMENLYSSEITKNQLIKVDKSNMGSSDDQSKIIKISKLEDNKVLKSKIILIDSADPGFDWVFSHKITGLITKFGGTNSHMAIRCAELNLPAAIGVGEKIFQNLLQSSRVYLDPKNKILRPI